MALKVPGVTSTPGGSGGDDLHLGMTFIFVPLPHHPAKCHRLPALNKSSEKGDPTLFASNSKFGRGGRRHERERERLYSHVDKSLKWTWYLFGVLECLWLRHQNCGSRFLFPRFFFLLPFKSLDEQFLRRKGEKRDRDNCLFCMRVYT